MKHQQAYTVACPFCAAPAGKPCFELHVQSFRRSCMVATTQAAQGRGGEEQKARNCTGID